MNENNFSSKIEGEVYSFLKSHGYPDGALIYEPTIMGPNKKQYRPDFLVVDPENNERLAIFEVEPNIGYRSEEIINKINNYRLALGNLAIPQFIVIPSKEYVSEKSFEIYTINEEGNLEKIDLRLFPNFKALSSNKIASKKEEITAKKDATTNSFEKITKIMAGLLVLLALSDFVCTFFKIVLLNTERMTMLGAAVALIVIPYAQKFKGLGIEWEKATSKKEKDS